MANASFALGMVASIADKLTAMKAGRDKVNHRTGRDLVVVKAAVVDDELGKLGLKLRTVRGAGRMVSPWPTKPAGRQALRSPLTLASARLEEPQAANFRASSQ